MQTGWCKLNTMKALTYEATVERGVVKLPETVKLPEHAKVYVVVPGAEDLPRSMIHTPHLLRPEQAADFAMEIVEGDDAAVR
jgi:predicted DNA-binding antitoxin AbrB/MazE fold protein